jgi:hypothetical protein
MVKWCDLVLPARLLVLSLNDAIASSSTRERSAAARASIMRACSIDDAIVDKAAIVAAGASRVVDD